MHTHIQESTLYPDLVQYLISQGFDAIGETKFADNQTRPDILFSYAGQKFVVEVKIDEIKVELTSNAVSQAWRYAEKLGTTNVIVLVYPKNLKGQPVINSQQLKEIVLKTPLFTHVATDKWSKSTNKITFLQFVEALKENFVKEKPTIDFDSVVTRVNKAITDFNAVLFYANREELAKEVVDKLDLFSAIGDFKDKESASVQVLNLASFLLFNQILFYHIFHKKTEVKVPEIQEVKSPKEVQQYFDAILQIDYKSIYKVNILGHIPNEHYCISELNSLILLIKSLRAEHITHDLAGRFFHELIPHEVRKVLAAFYTHPNAADLLAGLLIDSPNDTIIDPACGSGTLLVAGYKRKQWLYEKMFGFANQAQMHKDFIEKEITGIDIMPFAAHISTINLTMQNIEQVTNVVRFATRDSLQLAAPLNKSNTTREEHNFGIDIEAYTETIQGTIFQMYEQKAIKQGAINAEGVSAGFKLILSDAVIMNPPYSDREKMPKVWKDKLNANEVLNKYSGNLINLWGYFMILGDLLVKEGGLVGSVIPINFARGAATEKIREFTLQNHTLRYIIKPVGDIAFSEGAIFKDILLVTEKKKPSKDDVCKIVYFKKSIKNFKNEEMPKLYNQLRNLKASDLLKKEKGIYSTETFDILAVTQQTLEEKQNNLMYFLWAKNAADCVTVQEFYKTFQNKKLINFPQGLVREGFHSYTKGVISAVFITSPQEQKTRTERALMILESVKSDYLNVRIAKTELRYQVPREVCKKAIRTITGLRTIEVPDGDYLVTNYFPDFAKILGVSKFDDKNKIFDWEYVQKTYPKKMVHLVSATKFDLYSRNTSFIAFYSEEPMIATDSLKVYPNLSTEKAKILCLFLNSIVNLLQFITNRQQTTAGGYHAITETDLLNFQLLNYENLIKKEIEKLLVVFDSLKSLEFPSIVEQIEKRFSGRVQMDMAILEVLGYKKGEINEILPKLYEVVLRELKQDF